MITKQEFLNYKQAGFNLIPVWKKINCSALPMDVYAQCATKGSSYIFEKRLDKNLKNYSVVGLNCSKRIQISGNQICIFENSKELNKYASTDPLNEIGLFLRQYRVPQLDNFPEFYGGFFGCFGFDVVNFIEKKLLKENQVKDPLQHPDVNIFVAKDLVTFDHHKKEVIIIVYASTSDISEYQCAINHINALEKKIGFIEAAPIDFSVYINTQKKPDLEYFFPQNDFEKAVIKVKEYINNGDVMQVVISQRCACQLEATPMQFYLALKAISISSYLYFIDCLDYHIIGASPEVLVSCQKGLLTSKPMAGTRRRGNNQQEDDLLRHELINSEKENAEHLMLIDLARNDIGRVAQMGSVHLQEDTLIENYPNVMHLVSKITGQLKKECLPMDVIRATFPAGTLSGAPKIRALEIISELEPYSRGVYGGAIGYIDWYGNFDLAITIRTGIIQNKKLYIQAGAGIVADSLPSMEWQETCDKGKMLLDAAVLAEQYVQATTKELLNA